MAEAPIVIQVDFEGAADSASQLASVTRELGALNEQAESTEVSTDGVGAGLQTIASGGTQFVQRVQGMAGAVQGLVSAMGSRDRTAGLVASLAGSTAQFAAMGAMLGPAGAVVGGVLGFATGVIGLADAHREARPEIETTTEAIREEGEAALTAAEAMDAFLQSVTLASRSAGLNDLGAQITSMTDEMYRLRDAGDGIGAEVMAERIRTLTRLEASERANLAEESRTTGRARRGGGSRRPVSQGGDAGLSDFGNTLPNITEQNDHQAELAEQAEYWRGVEEEATAAHLDDLEAMRLDREARIAEGLLAQKEAQYEAEMRLAEEQEQRMAELAEQALEQREQQGKEIAGLFSQTSQAVGDTIADIATGEKTAEEAFKGLAASFLEMISQYASLKAATEFADAAASFARYDYGGGAAHVGAGLAFTAVAIATGVGAAVLNAPPSAPARPESSGQQDDGRRGGDVIIQWNQPVLAVSTRAELGRQISGLVADAGSI